MALAFELNTEIGEWRLAMAKVKKMKLKLTSPLLRRECHLGSVHHFEGKKGTERIVRCEEPDGTVFHFEGEKGTERSVKVYYFKGTKRVVRVLN